jgi:hypothetical protein
MLQVLEQDRAFLDLRDVVWSVLQLPDSRFHGGEALGRGAKQGIDLLNRKGMKLLVQSVILFLLLFCFFTKHDKITSPVSFPDRPKFSGAALYSFRKTLLADVQGKSINDYPLIP